MIIDIAYIKKVLELEDIDDSEIAYLINHYFNDVCEEINVKTSLDEQEIVTKVINADITPEFGVDSLSLFQETIIYGIACHLENMGIPITPVPNTIYNEYVVQIDLSNIPVNENGLYAITFCILYNYCLNELKEYLNDESQVGYIRRLLHLDKQIVPDSEIEFLIQHYTDYITELIKDVDTNSVYFKQALYLKIACHIYQTHPQAIASPVEYRVDEVSEVFNLSFDKFGNTWCDLAEEAMADLKKHSYKNYGVKVFDRPGARTKYNAWGPT